MLQTVELKVEMVGIHEKRLRKCLSKLKGTVSFPFLENEYGFSHEIHQICLVFYDGY